MCRTIAVATTVGPSSGATPWRSRNRRAISPPSTSKQRPFRGIRVRPTSCISDAVHRHRGVERVALPCPDRGAPAIRPDRMASGGSPAATGAPSARPHRTPRPAVRRCRRSSAGNGGADRIGVIVAVGRTGVSSVRDDDRRKHASLVRPAPSRLHLPGHPAERLFDRVIEQARAAEDAGFSLVTVMDHLYQIPGVGPVTEPMLEAGPRCPHWRARPRASGSGRS